MGVYLPTVQQIFNGLSTASLAFYHTARLQPLVRHQIAPNELTAIYVINGYVEMSYIQYITFSFKENPTFDSRKSEGNGNSTFAGRREGKQ